MSLERVRGAVVVERSTHGDAPKRRGIARAAIGSRAESARRRLASRHGRIESTASGTNFVLLDRWIGTSTLTSRRSLASRCAASRTISVDACAFSPRALVVFARLRASSRLSGDDLRRRRLHDDDLRLRSSPDPVRHGRRRRLSIVHLPTHLAL